MKEAMMARDVPQMVRGMSMGMRLLSLLIEEVRKSGGTEEILQLLTTPSGRGNLEKVAQLITSLEWKGVPESIVTALAREESLKDEPDGEYVEADQNFRWTSVLKKLNIPFVGFTRQVADDMWTLALPLELREQLHGKITASHMPVNWGGKRYVVVGLSFDDGRVPQLGEKIDMDTMHPTEDYLSISLVDYFDLDN
jgi:hypothetical protein